MKARKRNSNQLAVVEAEEQHNTTGYDFLDPEVLNVRTRFGDIQAYDNQIQLERPVKAFVDDGTFPRTREDELLWAKALIYAMHKMENVIDNTRLITSYQTILQDPEKIERAAWEALKLVKMYHTLQGPLEPSLPESTKHGKFNSFAQHMKVILGAITQRKTLCRHMLSTSWIAAFIDAPQVHTERVDNNRNINNSKKLKIAAGTALIEKASTGRIDQSEIRQIVKAAKTPVVKKKVKAQASVAPSTPPRGNRKAVKKVNKVNKVAKTLTAAKRSIPARRSKTSSTDSIYHTPPAANTSRPESDQVYTPYSSDWNPYDSPFYTTPPSSAGLPVEDTIKDEETSELVPSGGPLNYDPTYGGGNSWPDSTPYFPIPQHYGSFNQGSFGLNSHMSYAHYPGSDLYQMDGAMSSNETDDLDAIRNGITDLPEYLHSTSTNNTAAFSSGLQERSGFPTPQLSRSRRYGFYGIENLLNAGEY